MSIPISGLLVLAACTSHTNRPVAGPSATTLGPSTILQYAATAMAAMKSYRAITVVATRTATGPVTVRVSSQFELPDRVRSVTTVGKTSIQTITIKGNTWIKDPKTGVWKSKINSTAHASSGDPFAFLRQIKGLRLLGTGTVAGARADHIQGTVPASALVRAFGASGSASTQGTAQVQLWIDTVSYRLIRVIERIGGGSFTLTADLSEFGARFNIKAPK